MSKIIENRNFYQGLSINDDPALEREADVSGARDLHSATTIVNENSSGDQFFQQNYGPLTNEEKLNRGIPILNSLNEIEGPNSAVTQNFSNYVSGLQIAPSQARVFVAP
jgi:hypothetical protein